MFREKGKKFNWGCVEIKVAESHPYGGTATRRHGTNKSEIGYSP